MLNSEVCWGNVALTSPLETSPYPLWYASWALKPPTKEKVCDHQPTIHPNPAHRDFSSENYNIVK